MKKLLILGLCVLMLVGTFVYYFSSRDGAAALVIENKGRDFISGGIARICDHRFTFEDLAPGDFVVFAHRADCESGYEIEIWYSSGVRVKKKGGYVSSGFESIITAFVIEDGEIRFNKERID